MHRSNHHCQNTLLDAGLRKDEGYSYLCRADYTNEGDYVPGAEVTIKNTGTGLVIMTSGITKNSFSKLKLLLYRSREKLSFGGPRDHASPGSCKIVQEKYGLQDFLQKVSKIAKLTDSNCRSSFNSTPSWVQHGRQCDFDLSDRTLPPGERRQDGVNRLDLWLGTHVQLLSMWKLYYVGSLFKILFKMESVSDFQRFGKHDSFWIGAFLCLRGVKFF